MRHMYRGVVLAALLFGAACANDSTGTGGSSGSGTLILDLTTPHADDGAVLFEVSGPPIDAVAPVNSSLRLFTRRASETTIVGVVVGAVAEGAMVTLRVPDLGGAAQYTARIREVADRDNVLRASLAGYTLTVHP
jgi:NaMN:DMB phosphoribosyltransferase